MLYLSTNRRSDPVSFEEAAMQAMAADGGLWMPEAIPVLPARFIETLHMQSLSDICFTVASAFMKDDIPAGTLRSIVDDALDFDISLRPIDADTHVLELFHGPTLAFKDIGARFMARVMGHVASGLDGELTVLAATSGDTGGAVAHAFHGVPGTRVIVLYPEGRVSDLQERQFTTLGGNVVAVRIRGSFDDCQRLVKQSFLDPAVRSAMRLASGNSINIARLIPQTFYYFYAHARLPDRSRPVVFSVPSGNFGNLTAGLMAKRMGLPVHRFVAATNANDVIPEYLRTGTFIPRSSIETISNAMDIGTPSNVVRLQELCGGSIETMRWDIAGYGFSDDETRDAIRRSYERDGYVVDPHTAVGMLGLEAYRREYGLEATGVVLSTAHPVKFPEIVESVTGRAVEMPERMRAFLSGEKRYVEAGPSFEELRSILLQSAS